MGVTSVIQFVSGLAALVSIAAVGWLANYTFLDLAERRKGDEVRLGQISRQSGKVVSPGDLAFRRVEDLLVRGDFAQARERMGFIIKFSPDSAAAEECRRILTEMNLDEILDPLHPRGKRSYRVERGDFYIRIARKNETSLWNLAYLNGLEDFGGLQPGDELRVMPLGFEVRIDCEREALELYEGGEFVAYFQVVKKRLPSRYRGVVETEVLDQRGVDGARVYPQSAPEFRSASKVISLAKGNMQVRALSENGEAPPVLGFFLSAPAMEELSLLLRSGNSVEIRLPRG